MNNIISPTCKFLLLICNIIVISICSLGLGGATIIIYFVCSSQQKLDVSLLLVMFIGLMIYYLLHKFIDWLFT